MGIEIKTKDDQEKVWRLNELASILDDIDQAVEKAVVAGRITDSCDYTLLLSHSLCKSVRVCREIVCLAKEGYCDGAMSLARDIYEQHTILRWFENKRAEEKPDEFQKHVMDFFIAGRIQKYEDLKWESQIAGIDDLAFIKDQIEAECKMASYPPNVKEGKYWSTYWWAQTTSFNKLVKQLDDKCDSEFSHLCWRLHEAYRISCIELHAGPLGNNFNLSQDENFSGIDQSLHPERCGLPLWFATVTLIGVAGVAMNYLGADWMPVNAKLNELALYYDTKEKEELSSRPSAAQQSLNQD